MARRLAPHLNIDEKALKWKHTEASMKASMDRLVNLPEEIVETLACSSKFAATLKALCEMITDDEMPADVRRLATKTAQRLVGIAEKVTEAETKSQKRDMFGRRRW